MKIALLGDLHFGVRNDSEVIYEYQKTYFEDHFFPELNRRGITTVIQLGDFFDRRQYINFKTLYYLKSYFPELLEKHNITMYVLLGNHDTALKSSNHINSPSLLLNDFSRIKVIGDLTDLTIKEGDEEFNVAIVPWINNSNYKESVEFINNTKCDYICGHFEFQGFEMHKGHINETGMAIDLFDRFTKVISGHYHTKSDKGNILYTGTPYELTWTDWNDRKGFWTLDTNTHHYEFIPNPNSLFHRIEYWNYNGKEHVNIEPYTDSIKGKYVKLICVKKDDEYQFEQFVKKKLSESPNDLNVVLSVVEFDESMSDAVDNASKTLSQIIVENVNSLELTDSANPDELKKDTINMLLSIYTEIGGRD